MADLVLNGESLELSDGYRITQVQRSGHFSNDIRQDLTQPFTLPWKDSPRNRRILRTIDIPQAIIGTEKFSVLYEFGGTYYAAEMVLRELDEHLTVNIYFDKQAITILSKNVDDISIPNTTFVPNLYQTSLFNVWPDTFVFFPMIAAPNFFDDEDADPGTKMNPSYEGILNHYESSAQDFYANTVGPDGNGENRNTVVPQISLLYLLTEAFAIDGFRVAGDLFKNDAARRAFIFNNVSLDTPNPLRPYDNCIATRGAFYTVDNAFRLPFPTATSLAWDTADNSYYCAEIGVVRFELTVDFEYMVNAEWRVMFEGPAGSNITQILRVGGNVAPYKGKMVLKGSINIDASRQLGTIYATMLSSSAQVTNINSAEFKFTMDRVPDAWFRSLENVNKYLPDMPFVNFLKEVLLGLNLRMDIDRLEKVIYFNFRRRVLADQSTQDLTPYYDGNLQVEYLERKKQLVHYKPFDTVEEEKKNFIHGDCLVVYKDGSSEFPKAVPEIENFEGEVTELQTNPMITEVIDYETGTIATSMYYGRGVHVIYDTGGQKMTKLRLGFFNAPAGSLPTADHKYTYHGEGLDLHLSAEQWSVGNDWSQWLIWYLRDNRFYKAICHIPKAHLNRLHMDRPVHINQVKFLIDEVESIITGEDIVKIELRLKLI